MNKHKFALDHVAVPVANIAASVRWYVDRFDAVVLYQDETWAFLQMGQGKLALVTHGQHPPHIALSVDEETLSTFAVEAGKAIDLHRDGTAGVYIEDPDGNQVELILYPASGPVFSS